MNEWFEGGHMIGMWFWWLLGIALIVGVVWSIFRSEARSDDGKRETAEDILKRRYASGEIDKEEYERLLHDLRQ